MAGAKKTAKKRADKRGDTTLLRRRIIATVALVLVAGFATLSAFVWTKNTRADTNSDPFYSLATSSPKVRVFQPLEGSLDNSSNFVANGQAPPNSTVTVKVDGSSVGTATANSKGLWSKSISGVAAGDHALTASATISGPLSVVTSADFAPGFGLLDLNNNGLTSSFNTGLSTIFFQSLGQYSGQDVVNTYRILTPENSPYLYLVRGRSVLVVDIATQKPVKTIALSSRFLLEDGTDDAENMRDAIIDTTSNRIYILFSNDDKSQVLAVDMSTNTLVSQDVFNPSIQPATDGMVKKDGNLYLFRTNSTTAQILDLSTQGVTDINFNTGIRTTVYSEANNAVYVGEGNSDVGFSVSKLSLADNSIESNIVDLGTSFGADTLRVSSDGQRLYALSTITADMRTVDLSDNTIIATTDLGGLSLSTNRFSGAIFNDSGSRLYVPLQDSRVAMVSTQDNTVSAHVNVPAQSYTGLYDLMYYNNKLYTTYQRTLDPTDITNLSGIFSTIGISDANATSDVTPTTITSTGTATYLISPPFEVPTQTYAGTSNFSVGAPLTITSPTTNESLSTSTPTITGTGPKSKTIQLVVNGGSPISVAVGSDGTWQKQVTLPKDKFSKVVANYNNTRTQVVVPNTTILGGNIAKSELSVIDGQSALQQQSINLGDLGIQNVKLTNSAAINPNGQRYYTVSNDATSILNTVIETVLAAQGGEQPPDVPDILNLLLNAQIGSIGVYSAQTRQAVDTIQLPNGTIPLGITVSPDGKKGAVTALDVAAEAALLMGEEPIDESTPAPIVFYFVNLEDNTIENGRIQPNINLAAFANQEATPEQAIQTYLSIAQGIYILGRPGSFNSDSTKFYTTGFTPGTMSVVDVATKQLEAIQLPEQYATSITINSQFNKSNKILYVTYASITLPTEEGGSPQFVPGMMLINTQNNQIIGQTTLPSLPLFNFAVSSSGSKVYFITANFEDLIGSLTSTEQNSNGLLADFLPEFRIGEYDLGVGSYEEYAITNTEVPISLALSSDGSRLFIPTLGSNLVHVFDTVNKQVDPGNAPIVLSGLTVLIGSGDFANDAIIGSYTASGDYYVPADAPVTTTTGGEKTVVNNIGTTQFRYLPAAQQAAVTPQSITLPQQTVKTVQQTVEKAVEQQKAAQTQRTQTTWLIYLFYVALLTVLSAIGVTVWRTDMVLGKSAADDLFA